MRVGSIAFSFSVGHRVGMFFQKIQNILRIPKRFDRKNNAKRSGMILIGAICSPALRSAIVILSQ